MNEMDKVRMEKLMELNLWQKKKGESQEKCAQTPIRPVALILFIILVNTYHVI